MRDHSERPKEEISDKSLMAAKWQVSMGMLEGRGGAGVKEQLSDDRSPSPPQCLLQGHGV